MSLRKEDLELFEAVCNDPQLSKCVKTLEYDAVGFSTELTKDEYMEGLWTQILPMTITNNSENEPPFDCPDSQVNEFVEIIRNALKNSNIAARDLRNSKRLHSSLQATSSGLSEPYTRSRCRRAECYLKR